MVIIMNNTKAIVLLLTLLTSAVAFGQPYSVSGRIFDPVTGLGVQGAVVTIETKSTTTDQNGHYSISDAPLGDQVISVTSLGFSIDDKRVNITGELVEQNLEAYSAKILPVPALKARKDTRLLCLDGCYREGDGGYNAAWNTSRESAPNLSQHDEGYCVYTQIVMINRFFGGTFTRDEAASIAHQYATPEKELGHGWAGVNFVFGTVAYRYALNGGAGSQELVTRPSNALIKDYIDSGRPICWNVHWDKSSSAHAMVVSGYRYKDGKFEMQFLNTDNNGSVEWFENGPNNSTFFSGMVAPQSCQARNSDPDIKEDSDEDGVTDYDEKHRWNGNFDLDEKEKDTDKDGLLDGKDIEGWLFRGQNAPTLGGFDDDKDGLRGEVDPDSDNGGVMDGDEDADHDANKNGDETDPYAPVSPNSDDIPKVKITLEPSVAVGDEIFVDVTQEVTATFVFYGKNGTSTVPIFDKDAGPLTVTFTPNGGTATTVTLTHTGDMPTAPWTGKFTMGNAVPSGKVEFSVKNGSSDVEIIEGKEFRVDAGLGLVKNFVKK